MAEVTIRLLEPSAEEMTGPLEGVGSPLNISMGRSGTYDVVARAEGYYSDCVRVTVQDDPDECPSTITEHVRLCLAPLP